MISATRYADVPMAMDRGSHGAVIGMVGRDKRVIELGPATGYMSAVLRANGCTVFGIEADSEAAELAREHCHNVFVRDLDRLDDEAMLPLWGADVIVAADVLEHLKDPASCLRYVKRWGREDGDWSVVASVPNVAHGSVRLALLAGAWNYNDTGLLDRTHLRWFTRDTLCALFAEAGYRVTELVPIQIPIEISEVPWPQEETVYQRLAMAMRSDPTALAYQYVVRAVPV